MPTTTFVTPPEGLPFEDGESLAYSIGNVDVWRPTVAVELTEPGGEGDPEWRLPRGNENPLDFDGQWTVYSEVTDEDGNVTGYTVTRNYWVSEEAFVGWDVAQSDTPPASPPESVLHYVRTTEAYINILDIRLWEIDPGYGRYAEITPDE